MKKFIFSLILLIIISTNILANEEKYSKENCKKIYDAIGTFLYLAHVEWEKKTEEGGKKGLFYSQAAANYSTVYDTVCK